MPIGAEVTGSLAEMVARRPDDLRRLLAEHRLLVFRDQDLSFADQVAAAKRIGPIPQDTSDKMILSTTGLLGAGELAFHSDLAFDAHPHLAASLYALDIEPAEGTTTEFVDGIDGYERLAPEVRDRVAELYALHVFPLSTTTRLGKDRPDHYPRAVHPVAWPHPATGRRVLYVNSQATERILGLSRGESDELLAHLFDVLYTSAAKYCHRWRTGDYVLWDNRSLQHARGSQAHMQKRVLQRVVVDFMSFEERYSAFLASDSVSLRKDPALERV
jgi:taurine dioxygenase